MTVYPQSAASGEADSSVLLSLAFDVVGSTRSGRLDSGIAAPGRPVGLSSLAFDDDEDLDFDDDGLDEDDDFDEDFEDDYDDDDLEELEDFDDDEVEYEDFDDDDF